MYIYFFTQIFGRNELRSENDLLNDNFCNVLPLLLSIDGIILQILLHCKQI